MIEKRILKDLHTITGGTFEEDEIDWITREQVGSSLGPLIRFETLKNYVGKYVWVYHGGKYSKAYIDEWCFDEHFKDGDVPLNFGDPGTWPVINLIPHKDIQIYLYLDTGLELKAPNIKRN